MPRYQINAILESSIEDLIEADNEKAAFESFRNRFQNGDYTNKKKGEHIAKHDTKDVDKK